MKLLLTGLCAFFLMASTASAADAEVVTEALAKFQLQIDGYLLIIAAALVLLMQLGFAFLESGICRSKNTVNIMMKNFVDISISVIIFCAIGYAFLFGNNPIGLFGASHFFLNGTTEQDFAFIVYQMMFAATAVTITSGAMAERTKFFGYLVSAVLITGFIYPIAASWVWGGINGGQGWLAALGFIDLAGASVVHSVGGWVALAGVIVIGSRSGRFNEEGKPTVILGHNLALVAFGGLILWVGWFGFNGGSAIGTDLSIGKIVLNTNLGAAGGVLGVVLTMKLFRSNVLLVTTVNGALGGLVSITAGAATMSPLFALISGFVGGFVVFTGERLLLKLKLDDVIGAIPVHAFCGMWGTIAAGLFYAEDMFSVARVLVQIYGIVAIFFWSFLTALLVYFLIDMVIGLRVERRSERRGLDYSEHYEIAYPEFSDVQTHAAKTSLTRNE